VGRLILQTVGFDSFAGRVAKSTVCGKGGDLSASNHTTPH